MSPEYIIHAATIGRVNPNPNPNRRLEASLFVAGRTAPQ